MRGIRERSSRQNDRDARFLEEKTVQREEKFLRMCRQLERKLPVGATTWNKSYSKMVRQVAKNRIALSTIFKGVLGRHSALASFAGDEAPTASLGAPTDTFRSKL